MRSVLFLVFFALTLSPARANVEDYCAAYARDFADNGNREKIKWQRRFDDALKTCREQFSSPPTIAMPKKPPKREIKVEAPKPKTSVAPPPVANPLPLPQLQSGSPEWIAYCKNKYVSFNEATGTYQSKTGIERKCLVTAD